MFPTRCTLPGINRKPAEHRRTTSELKITAVPVYWNPAEGMLVNMKDRPATKVYKIVQLTKHGGNIIATILDMDNIDPLTHISLENLTPFTVISLNYRPMF